MKHIKSLELLYVPMQIIRVFPRKTRATPTDENVRTGRRCEPDMFDEADEIHISVTFSYDLAESERLEKLWRHVAPAKMGGPATGEKGGDFIPGMYLKPGYVITSRGCPNSCWFCEAWKREGQTIRELPIMEGNNLLDDNILSCSDSHIKAVFEMLKKQKDVEFTGGLEAAKLQGWHAKELKAINPVQVFFAYDTPEDLEPLHEARKLMINAGFKVHPFSHALRAYVLCGYKGDTFEKAIERFTETRDAGFTPMATLYRDKSGERKKDWISFVRQWIRPQIIYARKS